MAFPTSPSNNQTALVNGIVYQWNSTLGVWKRNGSVDSITVGQAVLNSGTRSTSNASGTLIVSGGAGVTGNLYTGGIYITGSANGITFPDGTVQTTASVAVDSYARTTANSATTLAQAAFDSANVISGVDTTQNTNITAVNTYATSAYGAANTNATNIGYVNTYAASAYALANTKFNTSGGTITGDTVVTGNLTVTGTQFYANTVNLNVQDNIITLNSNITGAPTLSAGIEVNRGSSTNTKLLWSEANSAWEFTNNGTTYDRIPSQVYANAAYAAANTNATNIGYVNTYAASAYAQANTNATNISVIQGVDNTQNTNITAVNTYAASAYGAANTNATNIGYVNTYAASAYAQANTNASNITIIQGVNTTQNTNITTVTTLAQAAFDKANTGSSSSADQYARDTANTASANTIYTQGVDATQNTNITSVNTYATSAYGKANTVGTLAQAAFDKANTGGGGTSSFAITVDTFSGNGSNTSFTLSAVPSSKNETMVHINGVYQNKNTYSVSGSTITFTGVASVSDTIEVETAAGSLMNVSNTAYSTRIYTGNGSQNTFTISGGQTANTLFVFNNGICQFPGDDYTVSGTTLTYVVTPQADEVVQIREMPVGRIVPVTVPNMRRYTADGVQTTFTVSFGQTANSMFVYENGVCQVPGNDYSVSGTTLTFVTAPTSDKVIQIREMPV